MEVTAYWVGKETRGFKSDRRGAADCRETFVVLQSDGGESWGNFSARRRSKGVGTDIGKGSVSGLKC